MALVKVIGISGKPRATLKYEMDKNKTNNELTTGINTLANIEIAYNKMKAYQERYKVNNKVKGFHVIHSFSNKENISPEKAHEISLEWFKKVFPDNTIAVASTHTNTKTLHTHFYINNVGLNGERIRIDKSWINKAKEISNQICKDQGLKYSFIKDKKVIPNKSWYEYQQEKIGQSWKAKIREDIDKLIPLSKDINDLYNRLQDQGYELKLDRKYVAVKPKDKDRFVRLKTLGYNYTPEQLDNRIKGLDKFNLPERGYYASGSSNK